MSVKDSCTTADFLEFDYTLSHALNLLENNEKKVNIAFLIILGIHIGFRISDILKLKHRDLYCQDYFSINEQKSGKNRTVSINKTVKNSYLKFRSKLKCVDDNDFLFISQKKQVFTIRQVNRLLQAEFKNINKNISSHSLRKTFGRRVWGNDNYSEKSLIILSKMFNHETISTTRLYLGIHQGELNDIYLNL